MMPGWIPAMLLAGAVCPIVSAGSVASAVGARPPLAVSNIAGPPLVASRDVETSHDFHVSYTRMAVERTVVSAQLRLFTDDLARALVARARGTAVRLGSPQGDAAFQAYVEAEFIVTANGRRLVPVVASGAPERDMHSYVITWTSPVPITSVTMHNAALMELFDDQQNIVKVKHIGTGTEATLFFSGGSKADQAFRF